MNAPAARGTERAGREQGSDADRRVLEIVSSIVHEMRGPLATLVAAAELLDDDRGDGKQQFTGTIDRQARRLNGIIDAVLRAYAVTSPARADDRDLVDVASLVRDLCAAHTRACPSARFVVTSEELQPIALDRTMFEIVLTNLLSNAVKYSPQGSRIFVSAHHYEDALRVVVEDEGPGIREDDEQQLFGAGARGSDVRAEGHGLGLFIARTVCEAMGGELFVERPERTCGARFAIEIRSEGASE